MPYSWCVLNFLGVSWFALYGCQVQMLEVSESSRLAINALRQCKNIFKLMISHSFKFSDRVMFYFHLNFAMKICMYMYHYHQLLILKLVDGLRQLNQQKWIWRLFSFIILQVYCQRKKGRNNNIGYAYFKGNYQSCSNSQ